MAWVPLTPTSTSYFVYLILNRLSQFAVPTFIFASCVLLSYIHGDVFRSMTTEKLKTFYRKRFVRIIPPYLIWTLVYVVVKHIESNGTVRVTWETILTSFLGVMGITTSISL